MAKQCGIFRFTGQMGGISFYKRKGKYYARRKTSHNVATDPRFTRTYLSGLDFGAASRASKLFRTALAHCVKSFSDPQYYYRLTARFYATVRADNTQPAGQHTVSGGDLSLVKNFEFNKKISFEKYFPGTTVSIDRGNDQVTITMAPYAQTGKVKHTDLVVNIVSVNFKKGTYTVCSHNISLVDRQTTFTLDAPLHADPETSIIVTLGVPAGSNRPGAMTIAAVDQPAPSAREDSRDTKMKRSFQIYRSQYRQRSIYRSISIRPLAADPSPTNSGPPPIAIGARAPVNHLARSFPV
jgi:hypothetical protein